MTSTIQTRHRTDYILGLNRQVVYNCDKLKFYCNTGKTANGNYQHNDSMTSSVPTKCLGKRESGPGVTEGKQVFFSVNLYQSTIKGCCISSFLQTFILLDSNEVT